MQQKTLKLRGSLCVCLMAQLMTGKLVDWSSLPILPLGPGSDKDTRSKQGSARAKGQKADGELRKAARHSFAGDRSFDREVTVATGPVASFGGVTQPQLGGGLMPPASVHATATGMITSLPRDPNTRSRGLRDNR